MDYKVWQNWRTIWILPWFKFWCFLEVNIVLNTGAELTILNLNLIYI